MERSEVAQSRMVGGRMAEYEVARLEAKEIQAARDAGVHYRGKFAIEGPISQHVDMMKGSEQ